MSQHLSRRRCINQPYPPHFPEARLFLSSLWNVTPAAEGFKTVISSLLTGQDSSECKVIPPRALRDSCSAFGEKIKN